MYVVNQILYIDNQETAQNCTKTKFHEGTKLHEDIFGRVTILHGGLFLHEGKKKN